MLGVASEGQTRHHAVKLSPLPLSPFSQLYPAVTSTPLPRRLAALRVVFRKEFGHRHKGVMRFGIASSSWLARRGLPYAVFENASLFSEFSVLESC